MSNIEEDIELLSDVLASGLQGAMNINISQVGRLFGAGKRLGPNKDVPIRAISKFIEQNEDALPIIAGALSASAAKKLREILDKKLS